MSSKNSKRDVNNLMGILLRMGFGRNEIKQSVKDMGYDTDDTRGYEVLILSGIHGGSDTTGKLSRLDSICHSIDRFNLPNDLAMQALQSYKDSLENGPFDKPIDFESALAVEQEIQQRGLDDTHDSRMKLWDEMLKFSRYKTIAKLNGETEVVNQEWNKSRTKAHNNTVQKVPQSERLENDVDVEQSIMERFYPDVDPLPDMESFVYYP